MNRLEKYLLFPCLVTVKLRESQRLVSGVYQVTMNNETRLVLSDEISTYCKSYKDAADLFKEEEIKSINIKQELP